MITFTAFGPMWAFVTDAMAAVGVISRGVTETAEAVSEAPIRLAKTKPMACWRADADGHLVSSWNCADLPPKDATYH